MVGDPLRAVFRAVADNRLKLGDLLGSQERGQFLEQVWKTWYSLWSLLDVEDIASGIDGDRPVKAKEWGRRCRHLFWRLIRRGPTDSTSSSSSSSQSLALYSSGSIVQGFYPSSFITPYVHAMCEHVEELIMIHRSIKFGSCQSLELMNNLHGRSYMACTSRRFTSSLEILVQQYRTHLYPVSIDRTKYFCAYCLSGFCRPTYCTRHEEKCGRKQIADVHWERLSTADVEDDFTAAEAEGVGVPVMPAPAPRAARPSKSSSSAAPLPAHTTPKATHKRTRSTLVTPAKSGSDSNYSDRPTPRKRKKNTTRRRKVATSTLVDPENSGLE